jgi:quercetin dioxygenase-like cupin family protein
MACRELGIELFIREYRTCFITEENIMTSRPHLNAERPLDAPVQQFKLNRIAQQTWAEAAGAVGHNAITLWNTPNLRLVLLTMHAGSQLQEHDTFAPFSLHVISGHIRFSTPEKEIELGSQMVVTLEGSISYSIDAVENTVCLLTLGGAATASRPAN